ncbi:hypothetical protein [Streptomyces sp. SAI-127]|uniref:hypothetical protein n=1 Tax=Streptomyces sp. SAI-127 TaxID=2940543 RepID=UPI00247555F4|nr:hypothetical protein [Streptomyces sp. SAI-127]MDH6489620.1 hypothetical protein [Streptomyces sp. SAI-127]
MKRYRCDDCGSTSTVCVTDGAYWTEARRHRNIAHAGLIPDGERAIYVPVANLLDIPRGQAVASAILFVVMVAAVFMR